MGMHEFASHHTPAVMVRVRLTKHFLKVRERAWLGSKTCEHNYSGCAGTVERENFKT